MKTIAIALLALFLGAEVILVGGCAQFASDVFCNKYAASSCAK